MLLWIVTTKVVAALKDCNGLLSSEYASISFYIILVVPTVWVATQAWGETILGVREGGERKFQGIFFDLKQETLKVWVVTLRWACVKDARILGTIVEITISPLSGLEKTFNIGILTY